MMQDSFTHEVWADLAPRRRVRISGPVYGDDSVPLLRIGFEDGDAELMPASEMRLFHPLYQRSANPVNVSQQGNRVKECVTNG